MLEFLEFLYALRLLKKVKPICKTITRVKLDQIDQNARAYGFEIGWGQPLAATLSTVHQDNPFIDPDWRKKVMPEIPRTFEEASGRNLQDSVFDQYFGRKRD